MLFFGSVIFFRFGVALLYLFVDVTSTTETSNSIPPTEHIHRYLHQRHQHHHHQTSSPSVITAQTTTASNVNTHNVNSIATNKVQDRLLALYTTRPRRIDGRWSKWSPWSPCSRSCGGGVSVQIRQCISRSQDSRANRRRRRRRQNAPTKRGNQCVGLYKRHQLCNDKPCPITALDFRYEQCAAFNNRLFRGLKYVWEPYLEASEECALNCRPSGQDFYATLNRTVIDGTPCKNPLTVEETPASQVMRGICVEGKCRAVGPNGILGLDLTKRLHQSTSNTHIPFHSTESCSTCDGPNTKCMLMSFIFTQPQMAQGYATVATIPKGACSINITQLRPTRNHLALRHPDGSYFLNGNWIVNKEGTYEAAGTKFIYQHSDGQSSIESITAIGPLTHPVDVMLLYRVPNPGIKYEYKIPSGIPIPLASTLEKIAPPSIDLRRLDRPAPQADEAPRIIPHSRIPKNRRKKYSWKVSSSRTPCSKTCGNGFQMQIVICVRESTQIPVHERRCLHLEKPNIVPIRCAVQPCSAHWVSTWSPCSVTCGKGGEQRRLTLECKQEISSKLIIMVNEGACMEPKPPTRKPCFVQECNTTNNMVLENEEISTNDLTQDTVNFKYWKTGPWSQCSATCGIGYRSRMVTCHGAIRSDECPPLQRPTSREPCENLPVCPDEVTTIPTINTSSNTISAWLHTEWSQNCEDDCGTGSQYRRAACFYEGETCADNLKPETHRACSSDRHCIGKWYTGPWGRCIEPCSSNPIQKREVLCIVHVKGQSRIVSERACSVTTRPEFERPCHEVKCPPQWFVSDWGICNSVDGKNSCENAIQRREVRCLDRELKDTNECDGDTPPVKRTCEPTYCNSKDLSRTAPGDQPAPDSSCIDKIDRCRTAVQARLCQYEYYKTKCCQSCSRAPEIPRE